MNSIKVLNAGEIQLVDHMGDDRTVVRAARASFAKEGWMTEELQAKDEKLIHYLADNKHVSPFYHPQLQFIVKAPISVQRQAFKHKIGTAENSESTRYAEMKREFYIPNAMRQQSTNNKQGSEGFLTRHEASMAESYYTTACNQAFDSYEAMLRYGVAKELAREVLPLATYTTWYWTMSLMAVVHFINLRDDSHAQVEIQMYAQAMRELASTIFPVSLGALIKG